MTSAATARISRDALSHNLSVVKSKAPGKKVMAVIKADAYGHGMVEVARALNGTDGFAVAHIEEAIQLRSNKIRQAILLLQGVANQEELDFASRNDCIIALHDRHQLDLIENNPTKPVSVWIKIDTGMNRLGFSPESLPSIWSRLIPLAHVQVQCIMSHFACADQRESEYNNAQLARFNDLQMNPGIPRSMANTAAIFSRTNSHFEWIRPGLSLYGLSPFSDMTGGDLNLEAAMSFESRVIAIKQIKAGQTVGYGGRWKSPHDTFIAVIGAGYGDGYPRHAEDDTPVYIRDRVYPLVGRVSMDMITVDIGPTPSVVINDLAQLWGRKVPLETVAKKAGTIPYELSCRMTPRVEREYV